MKKRLIAITALVCATVIFAAALSTPLFVGQANTGTAEVIPEASVLASTATGSEFPSNDALIPSDCEIWDGSVADGFAKGMGDSSEPYLISTPAEFAFFIKACNANLQDANKRMYANAHYRLTKDLVFNPDFTVVYTERDGASFTLDGIHFTTDGGTILNELATLYATVDFKGTFDGSGHSLFNLYCPIIKEGYGYTGTGMFGQLHGEVKNLHFTRGFMSQTNDNGGGTFARLLYGTLSGCSSGMTYLYQKIESGDATGSAGIGGLVGIMQDKTALKHPIVENCEFKGTLICHKLSKITKDADGNNITPYYVENVYNNVNNYVGFNGVGGIVGKFNGSHTHADICKISNCTNRGQIIAHARYVGGILGMVSGSTWEADKRAPGFRITSCANFGDINLDYQVSTASNNTQTAYAGGIVGGASGLVYSGASITFEYCSNFGDINAQGEFIGGMIGACEYQNGGNQNTTMITGCSSFGNLTSGYIHGENYFGGNYVGGLIGRNIGSIYISDCTTGGTLTGFSAVGGMIGLQHGDAGNSTGSSFVKISHSHAETTVKGTGGVGGLIGQFRCGTKSTNSYVGLSGTFVNSKVYGETNVGGIIGILRKGASSAPSVELDFYYSISDAYVELVKPRAANAGAGTAGLVVGKVTDSASPTLIQDHLYVSDNVFDSTSGTPVRQSGTLAIPPFETDDTKLKTTFSADDLTGSTYLNYLNFISSSYGSNIEWVKSGVDQKPVHKVREQIRESVSDFVYNGSPIKLYNPGWQKVPTVCNWYRLEGSEWVAIDSMPKNAGKYRGEVALLAPFAGANGSQTVELTIEQCVVDFSKLEWEGAADIVFDGMPHTVSLKNVPKELVLEYENNSAVDVKDGGYVARLVNATDPTKNYILNNIHLAPTMTWNIKAAELDMNNIEWTAYDAEKNKPVLTYTGELQTIYLYDKTNPDRDLSRMLNIVYSGNQGTDVSRNYYASATISWNSKNINVSHERKSDSTDWEIVKRVIRPWADLALTGGAPMTGDHIGVSTVYDAAEHFLGFDAKSLPDCVTISIAAADESTGKHISVGTYGYKITVKLTDTDNNIFALEATPGSGEYETTTRSELSVTRYLKINPATPLIYGALSQDTTYSDPDEDGKGIEYQIGVLYNQKKEMVLDENGLPISTLSVQIEGTETLQQKLSAISLQKNFTIRYYQIIEEVVNGETVKRRVPVTNEFGNEQNLDGSYPIPCNAGKYEAEIEFDASGDENFTNAKSTATLIINRATYVLNSLIVMRDETRDEDGDKEQILKLVHEELLPDFITPEYSCAMFSEEGETYPSRAGKYLFTVKFVFDEDQVQNYYPLDTKSAYLFIETKQLLDATTGIRFDFNDGTYWRLLVKERKDVDRFVTDWSIGFDTKMAKLYQIELKDQLANVWQLEDTVNMRIPITQEAARADKLYVVFVTIDENGKVEMEKVPYVKQVVSKGEYAKYVDVSVDRIGYYGIVTTVENSDAFIGRAVWFAVAGLFALIGWLVIMIVLCTRSKKIVPAKVFLVVGMVTGGVLVIPIVVGILAWKQMKRGKPSFGMTLCVFLFCNWFAGLLLFMSKEEEYQEAIAKAKKKK